MYDEAWYGNTGYNFSIGNGFHNTIVGSNGNANFLFPFLSGLFFKLFGTTIFVARLLPALCGVAFLYLLHLIFDLLNIGNRARLIAYAAVAFMPVFDTAFRVARPECLAMALLLTGCYYYILFLQRRRNRHMLACGFWMSLALLAHPYAGLWGIVAGLHFLLLWWQKKERILFLHLCCYGIIIIAGAVVLVLVSAYYNNKNFSLSAGLNGLLERTGANSSVSETIIDRAKVFFSFWFFSSRAIFSFPLLFITIAGLFMQNNTARSLAAGSLIYMLISFVMLKNDMEMFPQIFFYFSSVAVITGTIVINGQNKHYKFATGLLIGAILVINLSATVIFNFKKRTNDNIVLTQAFSKVIPAHATVFGPLRLWFFCPGTVFFSDHYRNAYPDIGAFDYIIINSVDEKIYDAYRLFKPGLRSFRPVYQTNTRQYGEIVIYKAIGK
jgi:4-amino-4-deoxy-L-arabinose transferase-like glycosyltransferase